MSRSPYFFVERFNSKTEQYELQHPMVRNYYHTDWEIADLFPYNGCHDLFSIVEGKRSEFFEMKGIHTGLPKDVSKEIKEQYESCCEYDYGTKEKPIKYFPVVRWFTYADMYIYCLEHPEVVDYEAMAEIDYDEEENGDPPKKIMKPTPLKSLMDRVNAFLEVIDNWDWQNAYSQIRIVYWIM